ncbi:MAG: hypothetical protein ABIO85_01695 [Sphingomicrobium sp.]
MKTVGYLISVVSALLLGIVAYKPELPSWKVAALIGGIAASIIGMILRLVAHQKEKAALAVAVSTAEVERGEVKHTA